MCKTKLLSTAMMDRKRMGAVHTSTIRIRKRNSFFFLVYEKGMTARAAALQLHINPRTTQSWVTKDQDPQDEIQRRSGSDRPPGRPEKLGAEHEKFLVDLVDENPSLVLDQMLKQLTDQFAGLEIKNQPEESAFSLS